MIETQSQIEVAISHRFGFADRLLSFPAAILAILVGKVFWTCRERIVDTDLGWHLRNGQFVVTNRSLPSHDLYSFTAAGSSWLDHSWLSEVFYYTAYGKLGLQGIFVVFILAVASLLVTVFLLSLKRAEDPLSAAVATIFGGLLAMVGFTPRAQNFGWLCFVGIFAIVLIYRDRRRAPLWLVPILFWVWINCHGGWPFGLAIFAIVFGSGLIRSDVGGLLTDPWTRTEIRRLAITFAVSLIALFANPYGYRLVLYPVDMIFRQKLNVGLGGEWASVDFNDSRGVFVMIVLGAVFVMALMPRRRWRIDEVLLIAFALFCGLKHIRFLIASGIVLPPVLAPQLGRLSSYDGTHERRVLNAVIIFVVACMLLFAFPTTQHLQAELDNFFPAGAVHYLSEHPQQGNMFNQYEWGGYLEWKLPQVKTFIDSRTDIFEYKDVLRDYVAISTMNQTDGLLLSYNVEYILYPADSPLAHFLSQDPKWQCIFQDGQAVIYRRVHT